MSLARRVASSTSQLMASHVAARLLALVTMPILTSLLSPGAYGTAALALTLVSLLSVIALAGIDVSYVRSYQSSESDHAEAVESYAWRFALANGVSAALIVWIAAPYLADAFNLQAYLFIFVAIGILASVAQTMVQAKARLAARYTALSVSVVVSALAAAIISIAIAWWWRRDATALLSATVLASFISVVMLGTPALHNLLKPSGLSGSARSSIFKVGVAAVLSAPAYWIMASSDRWFLGYFADTSTVGVYSVSYTIAVMGMLVNNAMLPVWTTETIREVESDTGNSSKSLSRVAEQLLAVLLVVWLGITAGGGDLLRLLAAPEFHGGAVVIPALAMAVLFHGVIHIATALFIVTNKLKQTIWWWLGGSVMCLVGNAMLVPPYGIRGAAITQTVCFAFVAGGLFYRSRRIISLQLRWGRLAVFAMAVLVCGYMLMPAWSEHSLISLLLKAPIGLVVLFIAFRIFVGNPAQAVWRRT